MAIAEVVKARPHRADCSGSFLRSQQPMPAIVKPKRAHPNSFGVRDLGSLGFSFSITRFKPSISTFLAKISFFLSSISFFLAKTSVRRSKISLFLSYISFLLS